MTLKYALIVNKEIVKFRNVPEDDDLLIGKLRAHNYFPVEDMEPPVHDYVTQTLLDKYIVGEEDVVREWIVEERPFEIAKPMKEDELKTKTTDDIGDELDVEEQESEVAATLVLRNQYAALIEVAETNEDLRAIIIEM